MYAHYKDTQADWLNVHQQQQLSYMTILGSEVRTISPSGMPTVRYESRILGDLQYQQTQIGKYYIGAKIIKTLVIANGRLACGSFCSYNNKEYCKPIECTRELILNDYGIPLTQKCSNPRLNSWHSWQY